MKKERIYNTQLVETLTRLVETGIIPKPSCYKDSDLTLKSPNLKFEYTHEEVIEIMRCKNDIVYFAETYCKVRDLSTGELHNIVLRDYQKELLENFQNERFNITQSSRQTGITLMHAIEALHSFTFFEDMCIQILDVKACNAIEKLQKIKELQASLPFYMKRGIISNEAKKLVNDHGSRIMAGCYTKNTIIGYNIHQLHIDNFAYLHPEVAQTLYRTLFPVMMASSKSKIIISSTPNGVNHFYELIKKAENDENEFKTQRIYWWQVPGRDKVWKEQEIKNLGSEELFNQEYNLKFFAYDKNKQEDKTIDNSQYKINMDELLKLKTSDEFLYHILCQGLKAYLGAMTEFTHDVEMPGGIFIRTVTPNMLDLLKQYKIIK
jgi:hypothetical protein